MNSGRHDVMRAASIAHEQANPGRAIWLMGREHDVETKIDILIAEALVQLEPGRVFEIRIRRGDRTRSESRHAVSWYSSQEMALNPQAFELVPRVLGALAVAHPQLQEVFVVTRMAVPKEA
jgi:hypothetical protein